jgi:hypothetical protein
MRRTAAIGYPRERDLVEDCGTEQSVAELPQCGKNRRRAAPLSTPCGVTFWIVSKSSHIACLRAMVRVNASLTGAAARWKRREAIGC